VPRSTSLLEGRAAVSGKRSKLRKLDLFDITVWLAKTLLDTLRMSGRRAVVPMIDRGVQPRDERGSSSAWGGARNGTGGPKWQLIGDW